MRNIKSGGARRALRMQRIERFLERRWIRHFEPKCPTSHPPSSIHRLSALEERPAWETKRGVSFLSVLRMESLLRRTRPYGSRRSPSARYAGSGARVPRSMLRASMCDQSTSLSTMRESWRRLRHSSAIDVYGRYLSITESPKPHALGLSGFSQITFFALVWTSRRHQALGSL
jgi:hypothetical protein